MDETSTRTNPPLPTGARALWEAMRPAHWVKNGFVVIPIVFAGAYLDGGAWWRCLLAAAAFNLLSSAVYLFNDLCDRTADRAHPEKRSRAIASGRLSPTGASVAAAVLALVGLMLSILPGVWPLRENQPLGNMGAVVWAGAYLLLNLLYSLWWKRYPIVDVILVAMSFVLRAMAGAAAIAAPISPWLVICTFTLCLFLALSKRRAELANLPDTQAHDARPANRGYRLAELDFMLTVSTAVAILSYCLYCLAPQTVNRIGSAHMIWTIPLVMYGIFRFVRVGRGIRKGDVVSVLLADKVLWGVVLLYVALSVVVIQFGAHPAVAALLDVKFPQP